MPHLPAGQERIKSRHIHREPGGKAIKNGRQFGPMGFPGSEEAFEQGCTCPQNQPWPGLFNFASDCPVHEVVRKAS